MAADRSDSGGYSRGDPEYRRIELALFIAAFVSFAQMYETQVLLPEISEHFHLDPSAASLTVSLTTGGLALALFLVGPSSERLGRRPIMLTSILVTSLVGMMLGFAPSWHLLLAGRFLQGVGAAGLPAVATAYLAEEVRARDLPRADSVSGNLVAHYGRRRVMPMAALLTLIGLVLTIFETLWIVIPALIVFAIGFFAVHATASGWVTARAVAGVGAAGQAASAYSISYYLGGSCFGTLGGIAWYHWGWSGLVALTGSLIALVVVLALLLRRIPPLQKSGY